MQAVCQEIIAKTDLALLAQVFFCPMMSLETARVLLSMLVSSEVQNSNIAHDEELEMAVFEIFRANFMALIDRKAYRTRRDTVSRCCTFGRVAAVSVSGKGPTPPDVGLLSPSLKTIQRPRQVS